jgi:hypothetical protein
MIRSMDDSSGFTWIEMLKGEDKTDIELSWLPVECRGTAQ